MPSREGRRYVHEYYDVAPGIVAAVNRLPDADRIWNSLYEQVRLAAEMALAGRFSTAFEHYRRMAGVLRENCL